MRLWNKVTFTKGWLWVNDQKSRFSMSLVYRMSSVGSSSRHSCPSKVSSSSAGNCDWPQAHRLTNEPEYSTTLAPKEWAGLPFKDPRLCRNLDKWSSSEVWMETMVWAPLSAGQRGSHSAWVLRKPRDLTGFRWKS